VAKLKMQKKKSEENLFNILKKADRKPVIGYPLI